MNQSKSELKKSQALFKKAGFYFNPYVFIISAGLILLFLLMGTTYPDESKEFFTRLQNIITSSFGWYYTASVGFFLFFVIWLLFSPYGTIRLGPDDSRPEYGNFAWFAMLFSAGMGIGLLFYSVAEPIMHFLKPPFGDAKTAEAARRAMNVTFFHWGLHAWGIYIVMGLALGYYAHRKGQPLSIRTAFYPLIGDRIHGRWGDAIDIVSVLGTLFGIATSLGLGAMQVNAGLKHIGIAEISTTNQLILIAVITLAATISVMSGLNRGILWLSNINIWLGAALLLFVFLTGPTILILESLIQNTGDYAQNLISLTFWNAAYQDNSWRKDWTLFYWAWWISWSPFVGMFIARISRGRTIREFILGVLLAPTAVTFVWLTVFGNTAISMESGTSSAGIAQAVQSTDTIPTALYLMLAQLPLGTITSLLATIVIASYFVTSSDSGSLVIDIITAGGHTDPPRLQRLFWALMEGCVAAVLLVTGGLKALQTAAITTALPLSFLLMLVCWGLVRSFRHDLRTSLSRRDDAEK